MKSLLLAVLAAFIGSVIVRADSPAAGVCRGGDQPAANCKTCEYCYYCGKKGKWGKRPDNSATCIVLDRLNAAKQIPPAKP